MIKNVLSVFLFLVSVSIIFAENFSISGKIVDAKDNSSLIGANIAVFRAKDTIEINGSTTDVDGNFIIENMEQGTYRLNISYIGYATVDKIVELKDNMNLNTIKLNEDSKVLKEVVIQEKQIRVQQLGDTTQFNAGAFKVNTDATTEDLLTKMPGVTSENGTVKVNGEEVKKVLIDGKEFFGNDPRTAIQNLPADIVDKVQVFDKLSDQSAFTGFDDGNGQKTINIITKNGLGNSKFGKVYAGYGGPDNRFNAGANFSTFKGDRRFSILAMSNNINQQNFNIQDLVGATSSGSNSSGSSMRGGSPGRNNSLGNFLVGQQNGIATTTALGINYSDKIGKQNKVSFSGSYFFNGTKNVNTSSTLRNYILSSEDSSLVYDETKDVTSKNFNNRVNLRIEYVIDSLNTLTFTPSFSTQNYSSNSILDATNTRNNESVESATQNNLSSKQFGINFSNDILYQHKFAKKGRTISANLNTSASTKNVDGSLFTLNNYLSDTIVTIDSINQKSNLKTKSYTVGGNVVYTEPIKKYGQISVNYAPSFTKTTSLKNTDNYDALTDEYTIRDTALSNQFNNTYLTNKVGIAYRYNNQKLSWSVGLVGQDALLHSEQLAPNEISVNKNFLSLLPNAEMNYKFSKTENLRFFYRTSNNPPSITQLQNVIDNSNSLILTSGNPDLKQNFSQSIGLRYGRTNTTKATSLFVFANAQNTMNYIANSTTVFARDTVINGISASAGTQYIQPTNLNGYWNARTFVTYGFPVSKLKSNMNINGGFVYTKTPTLINQASNNANSYAFNAGVVLSSNISTKIDFTVSYNASYNLVRNSLQQQNNSNYFNHTAMARVNYQFWKGFVFSSQVSNTLNAGGSSAYNTNYWLLNASLAYKFLKNESLEVKFSANDILNQNRNITRNIAETYTEDVSTTALRRYFMGTITYTFKKIETNGTEDKPKDFLMMPPPPSGNAPMMPPPGN
ncbi:MAG: TonB-dependent receptor [Sphingobacteriales bacterium]|nr:MAG: TonB-dependent receptor [Sphingobacteriales bacterium]